MPESSMRRRVVKALWKLDAQPVENSAVPGTPDVECIGGWIELKQLPKWPADPEGLVRIAHFTRQQRVFHIRRRRAGGSSWFLLQVKREWLLLDGAIAALSIGRVRRRDLYDLAAHRSTGGLRKKELAECISRPMKSYCLTGGDVERLRLLLPANSG